MAQTILLKRGLRTNLPASAGNGEPLYCTDTQELFIGTGSGRVKVKDVIVAATEPAQKIDGLLWVNTTTNVLSRYNEAGTEWIGLTADVSGKADKVTGATNGNIAGLDAGGNLTDSGKKVNDAGDTSDDLWTANKINTAIDTATSGIAGRLLAPVQDITALKAIDTTNADDFPDKTMINVEDKGLYRLDRDSSTAGDDDRVVAPTVGVGRWYKMSASINDHNNLNNIQGGTTGQHYHMTETEHTKATTNFDDSAKDAAGATVENTTSVTMAYNGTTKKITSIVKVDDTTIKIHEDNGLYVDTLDGGTF